MYPFSPAAPRGLNGYQARKGTTAQDGARQRVARSRGAVL
jgi:hypothetical protein